ncbi:diguanylate cyclase domain-containing protein [Billgrantia kenyensis]|uniref:Diguanylate cyclase n=1 Tax=Billgrantia kenyensis TaxID=321266 RepID=A0A7V9W0B7_9GAMM|nr:diguanylate cyclase [Halomonas kenyensis]MBA2778725.1 diguanylate cyclase [Halomonas kenyensis]MCG6661787.1 diguanylate cyclase [Halomonas kenyensis]
MDENPNLAIRFGAAYGAATLLLGTYAMWRYLMGDYDRILLPASLSLVMLVACLLRLSRVSQVRLPAYLTLIVGYLMLALELPWLDKSGVMWLGLAPLLTVLLLPLASAMLLNLLLAPAWLLLIDHPADIHLALSYGAIALVVALVPWEQRRQQVLLDATNPQDRQCNALARESLHELLVSEYQRTQFLGQPLGVLVVHLPQLEMASEQFGGRARQSLLDALCLAIHRCSRRHDFLGRQGSATFWLVLPDTSRSGAQMVQQRIEQSLESTVLVDTGTLRAQIGHCQRLPGESWPRFEQRLLSLTRQFCDT